MPGTSGIPNRSTPVSPAGQMKHPKTTDAGVPLTSVCVAVLADTVDVDTLFAGGNVISPPASSDVVVDGSTVVIPS